MELKSFREIWEEMQEADSMQTRLKKKKAFQKNKHKILAKRKKAMKKKNLDPAKLQKRAEKQARNMVAKKMLKDTDKSDLGMSGKQALEKKLDKKKSAIKKLAKKLLPMIRKKEQMKNKKEGDTKDGE
jgi:hypothetical protein